MSAVQIVNRAIQKLGGKRITSLADDSTEARELNVGYADLRDAELRANRWKFAIKRTSLAADSDDPAWGYDYAYSLPSDYLRMLEVQDDHDYRIEAGKILTDAGAPLYIRYVYRAEDPAQMDPLFRESLSARIAAEFCEKFTGSNTKIGAMMDWYKLTLAEARKINALEDPPEELREDSWITARQ